MQQAKPELYLGPRHRHCFGRLVQCSARTGSSILACAPSTRRKPPRKATPSILVRRSARLMRRRLRRRAWRLTKAGPLLKREGVIDDAMFSSRNTLPAFPRPGNCESEGLDRLLNAEEWARVIYHLCKHRGFHWISRAEEKKAEATARGKAARSSRASPKPARADGEKGYRSAAEMVLAEFPEASATSKATTARHFPASCSAMNWPCCSSANGNWATPMPAQLETAILGNGDRKSGLFWAQKPALAGADLLKMLGKCTFEKANTALPRPASPPNAMSG
jgi:CRISPR-associated endonuclease Csn1